jgi:hypothetical protein
VSRATKLALATLGALAGCGSTRGSVRDYAPIDGLRLHYEVHGPERANAPPLLLLHGGGSTIDTSFGAVLYDLERFLEAPMPARP